MAATRECPDEQIIVNQRCNLIIQYLERQNKDKCFQAQAESEKVKQKQNKALSNFFESEE